MKNYSILFTALLSGLCYINVHAQTSVKDKIVGCWKLDNIVFADPTAQQDVPPEAKNSVVCLLKDGKFTTKSGENSVTGVYMISDDGKTITQRMTGGMDDIGEITVLTDTTLELKTEEVTLKMTRVKE